MKYTCTLLFMNYILINQNATRPQQNEIINTEMKKSTESDETNEVKFGGICVAQALLLVYNPNNCTSDIFWPNSQCILL